MTACCSRTVKDFGVRIGFLDKEEPNIGQEELLKAIFIIPTFAIPIVALKPLDFPEIFEPTTSLGFAA